MLTYSSLTALGDYAQQWISNACIEIKASITVRITVTEVDMIETKALNMLLTPALS